MEFGDILAKVNKITSTHVINEAFDFFTKDVLYDCVRYLRRNEKGSAYRSASSPVSNTGPKLVPVVVLVRDL